ncbi:methyltransferase [Cupriavidus necator]|uniref:methyltransferase n=1 Tax=Cupriavidus necator TaxID=106590 RepID=UPI000A975C7B|nr:methyltransferase [Cupriavidus necator]
MKIAMEVMAVLDRAAVEGNAIKLTQQLDPALYKRVNKVLDAAGGKWNRKAQAHLFERDAASTIDQILLTGEIVVPQDFGYFPTPPNVVARLFELAGLSPGMTMLEPEAGTGNIARPAAEICTVDCVELLEANVKVLREAGFARSIVQGDFLEQVPTPAYDRIIMNPPFEKQADIRHVTHALNFLAPGGRHHSGDGSWRELPLESARGVFPRPGQCPRWPDRAPPRRGVQGVRHDGEHGDRHYFRVKRLGLIRR